MADLVHEYKASQNYSTFLKESVQAHQWYEWKFTENGSKGSTKKAVRKTQNFIGRKQEDLGQNWTEKKQKLQLNNIVNGRDGQIRPSLNLDAALVKEPVARSLRDIRS